jgi:hypothetical protein
MENPTGAGYKMNSTIQKASRHIINYTHSDKTGDMENPTGAGYKMNSAIQKALLRRSPHKALASWDLKFKGQDDQGHQNFRSERKIINVDKEDYIYLHQQRAV